MEWYLIVVLGIGVVVGYFIAKFRVGRVVFERDVLKTEIEQLRTDNAGMSDASLEVARLNEAVLQLQRQAQVDVKRWAVEKLELQERFAAEKEELKNGFVKEKEEARLDFDKAYEQMKLNFAQTKEDLERQWKEKMDLMKTQFQSVAGEVLKRQSEELSNTSREGWQQLMNPLQEKMQAFEKAVIDSKEKSAENTTKLETSIKHLVERSQEIGNEADRLTKALKGDSKVQGDWGEMVLERLLELSGLRRDEEYFVQMSVEGDEDAAGRKRPDVVVKFPEGRSVIIDSKVSLTAYTNYMQAESEEERARFLKEHLQSMHRHVDELNAKDYPKIVTDSIGYVLMFVPNEASYVLAVKNDDKLVPNAYKKKIVVISPTNLIMALQLAYNLWQGERQSKNTEEIFRRATALYEKFSVFCDTFVGLEKIINQLQQKFEDGSKQLMHGRGNIAKQFEDLKQMGINPKKELPPKVLDQIDTEV